jgi:hypothetical protein
MDLGRFYQRPSDLETSQQIVTAVMAEIGRLRALL